MSFRLFSIHKRAQTQRNSERRGSLREYIRRVPLMVPVLAAAIVLMLLGVAADTTWYIVPESGFSLAQHTSSQVKPLDATVAQPKRTVSYVAAGTSADPCGGNYGKLLFVSLAQQRMWACDGTTTVNQSAITSGMTVVRNGVYDATPTGTWSIYSKSQNRNLKGCDANGCWNDYVQYWMPYDGAVGFHDSSWQTFPFGGSQYHTDGSHGCVHLPTDIAAWVYGWAPIGTRVTVIAS